MSYYPIVGERRCYHIFSFNTTLVKSLIIRIFPILRVTQQENLARSIVGITKERSGILSVIVRSVPGAVSHKHRLKRLWRFVSNHRVQPEYLQYFWVAWCIRTFVPWDYVPIALDWTTLPGNLPCLMAAVPFHGRAVPLMWRIIPFSAIKDSQNLIEERLIAQLVRSMPKGKRLIIIADRGFGRADLMNFLIKHDLLFVLRIERKVIVTAKNGKHLNLKQMALQPEQSQWFTSITYRADAAVTGVNMAAVVAKGSDDPWFLITNLRKPETTITRYASRFQIEEWFKDLKHELGIDRMRIRNLKRIRRLVFIATIVYGFLLYIGRLANPFTTWKERLITVQRKTCSLVWLAIRIIHYDLAPAFFWRRVWIRGRVP